MNKADVMPALWGLHSGRKTGVKTNPFSTHRTSGVGSPRTHFSESFAGSVPGWIPPMRSICLRLGMEKRGGDIFVVALAVEALVWLRGPLKTSC